MRRTDPLIGGGGPAGSAAAIHLLRAGATPTLIERQQETGDALCGGFLSWRTIDRLEALGLSASDLGGHGVTMLRLFAGRRALELALPAPAVAVSRHRLDTLLLAQAERMGATVRRGVAALDYSAGGLRLEGNDVLPCDSLFLATGILGAFTTFSSFSLDFAILYERRAFALCALYTIASFVLSVGALFAGLQVMRRLLAPDV